MIKMKVQVGVSNRHCHLTKEVYQKLFGKEDLTYLRPLKQGGQYASAETLTIKGPKGSIDRVRVLGPLRDYNQVEVSKTDCYKLGIDAPMRKSGHLDGAADITLVGPLGEVCVPAAIIANRHIHISPEDAKKLGVVDDEKVVVKINTIKPGTIEAQFKVTPDGFFELHLDTEDANGFLLRQDDFVEIDLEKKL